MASLHLSADYQHLLSEIKSTIRSGRNRAVIINLQQRVAEIPWGHHLVNKENDIQKNKSL